MSYFLARRAFGLNLLSNGMMQPFCKPELQFNMIKALLLDGVKVDDEAVMYMVNTLLAEVKGVIPNIIDGQGFEDPLNISP